MSAIALVALVVSVTPPVNLGLTGTVTSVANIGWHPWADKPIYPHLGDQVDGEVALIYLASSPPSPAGAAGGHATIQWGSYLMEGIASFMPEPGTIWGDIALSRDPYDHQLGRVWPDAGTGELWIPYDGSPVWPEWANGDYRIEFSVVATERSIGDSNLDGRFDSSDLVTVFVAGEYEDEMTGNSRFVSGDWNADREFNSDDLVVAFQLGQYERPVAAVIPIAEPASVTLLVFSLLLLPRSFRQGGRPVVSDLLG